MILEDESGRIRLDSELIINLSPTLVTGVIIGVRGNLDTDGSFKVNDITYLGQHLLNTHVETSTVSMPMSMPVANTNTSTDTDANNYILLVSGLKIGVGRFCWWSQWLCRYLMQYYQVSRV